MKCYRMTQKKLNMTNTDTTLLPKVEAPVPVVSKAALAVLVGKLVDLVIYSICSLVVAVVNNKDHKKVTIFKMRRRKHYQKHQGHRQNYTEIRIDGISA